MKLLVASDIHGSLSAARAVVKYFEFFKCDYIVLLGDLLYHGPRNPLPEEHDPKAVAMLLNRYSSKIISCRGNCDAEVDQMVLDFPCQGDYSLLCDGSNRIFCTHGHFYSPRNPEGIPYVDGGREIRLSGANIQFFGHTHVQVLEKAGEVTVCNPGSLSLPKGGSPKGFALYDNGRISLYDIEGKLIKSI